MTKNIHTQKIKARSHWTFGNVRDYNVQMGESNLQELFKDGWKGKKLM